LVEVPAPKSGSVRVSVQVDGPPTVLAGEDVDVPVPVCAAKLAR